MVSFLRIWGMLSLVFAGLVLASGRNAMYEIEAGMALIVMTLSFGLSAIIAAVQRGVNELSSAFGRNMSGAGGEPCPHCGHRPDSEGPKLPAIIDDEMDRTIAGEKKWKW